MPSYVPYHEIIERHKDDAKFTEWLEQLKTEFHQMYPRAYLELDEHALISSYNAGMTPHMTLSEKHFD